MDKGAETCGAVKCSFYVAEGQRLHTLGLGSNTSNRCQGDGRFTSKEFFYLDEPIDVMFFCSLMLRRSVSRNGQKCEKCSVALHDAKEADAAESSFLSRINIVFAGWDH